LTFLARKLANSIHKKIRDAQYNSEFGEAERKARKAEDEYVETLHNTLLSSDQLSDDGSEEYSNLEQSYNSVLAYL